MVGKRTIASVQHSNFPGPCLTLVNRGEAVNRNKHRRVATLGAPVAPEPRPGLVRTEAGRAHSLLALTDQAATSDALWRDMLPKLNAVATLGRPLPGASVLVETATAPVRPVVATRPVGDGRVLIAATDETYRMRVHGPTATDRLWHNVITWLAAREPR